MITIRTDKALKQLSKNFKELDSKQVAKAAANAINRTLNKGRTAARQEVKKQYNIPQKNLSGVNQQNASAANLTGYIRASAMPIPMDAFAPKFETGTGSISISKKGVQKEKAFKRAKKNAAAGVSIEVKKGQRQVVPFAFMIRGAKPRVFARGQYKGGGGSFGFVQRHHRENSTGNDTPIKPLLSVTVHAAVINPEVEGRLAAIIEPMYQQRLLHELQYQADKMKSQA